MKRKNPLYVVSQKGSVVEEAAGRFDFLIKRFGLTPLVEMVKSLFEKLASLVTNYATLVGVREIMEGFTENIEIIMNQLRARFS